MACALRTRIGSAVKLSAFSRNAAKFAPAAPMVAKQQRRSMSVSASFHDYSAKALGSGSRAAPVEGAEVDFKQYAGKVVLVENVATL